MTKVTDREIEKRLAATEYAQGSIAHLAPGRNLADELITDRRAEDVRVRTEQDRGKAWGCAASVRPGHVGTSGLALDLVDEAVDPHRHAKNHPTGRDRS